MEIKSRCEGCGSDLLATGEAYICSYECTFCPVCMVKTKGICTYCGGELVQRPRRISGSQARSEAEAPSGERHWLIWLVSFGVWGFIAVVGAATISQFYHSMARNISFLYTLGLECSQDLSYAPLTPFVFLFATRFPIHRENWLRRSLLYLGGGLIFSGLHLSIRAATPFAVWDPTDALWHSAIWDSRAHIFNIRWPALEGLFLSNVVDDVCSAYLAIVLAAHMVSFYRRYREREHRTALLEGQLTKAHLQALKAQLHPHLLFNTMHSISALMLTDVVAADKMMSRLSDLLRMSLEDDTAQLTSLNHELEFVNTYLEIEKIRFGDRLNVVFDVAPETFDAQVPQLLLQPLVENAVRHGVAKLSAGGEIRLAAKCHGDTLDLLIRDNGPGLAGLDALHPKSGLGLRTTRERLQTLYGNKHIFVIRTSPQGGVEVSIRLPFRLMVQDNLVIWGPENAGRNC